MHNFHKCLDRSDRSVRDQRFCNHTLTAVYEMGGEEGGGEVLKVCKKRKSIGIDWVHIGVGGANVKNRLRVKREKILF